MKKFGIWGSIASIVGSAAVFLPPSASSQSQQSQATTYSDKSPAIGANHGNVTIQYGNAPESREKAYVLRNSTGSAILVVNEPNLDAAQDANARVCMVPSGTPVELTGKSERMVGIDMWRQIRITAGECANQTGWTTLSNLSFE